VTTLPPTTTTPPDTGPRTVTVKAGDSLSQIAKDNGMTLDELATLNAICDTNQLFVDQVLLLSTEEADDPDAEPSEQTITVQSGDSLSKIAKRHDTSVEVLMADNDIDDPNTIFVGQKLVVVSNAPATPTEDPCG
jgi:LysM repeat protein